MSTTKVSFSSLLSPDQMYLWMSSPIGTITSTPPSASPSQGSTMPSVTKPPTPRNQLGWPSTTLHPPPSLKPNLTKLSQPPPPTRKSAHPPARFSRPQTLPIPLLENQTQSPIHRPSQKIPLPPRRLPPRPRRS
ncbi:hypothetical protein CPB84DRAFT_233941 [Gymnopilus junonius]|uniref:Uncharacterized protein n=1 Tax=Gymnopilus junonius TaxID=109634 RepID=A0A9P5TII8_GYMJU|nr:hypothetical protein CPB84DRAFT_233941 [Gymnopilus junonius]